MQIWPNLRKVFKGIMQNHIYPYLNKIFSKYQCCFGKWFSAQHCFIAMVEKWRQSIDSGRQAAAVNCIDHELLIAKLNAYGFDNSNITFIYLYLSERKQRNKINLSFRVEERYYLVYPKIQSWDHFHLTLIYVTSFLK